MEDGFGCSSTTGEDAGGRSPSFALGRFGGGIEETGLSLDFVIVDALGLGLKWGELRCLREAGHGELLIDGL